jgi:hypothetical protein
MLVSRRRTPLVCLGMLLLCILDLAIGTSPILSCLLACLATLFAWLIFGILVYSALATEEPNNLHLHRIETDDKNTVASGARAFVVRFGVQFARWEPGCEAHARAE